jgi:RNase adaptor protein for sRNA GlmZ degradation
MTINSTGRSNDAAGTQVHIVSFGFGHGPAPAADLVLDLREWFRDPHVSPELRGLTGRDYPVIVNVLSTPGVVGFIESIFLAVTELVRLDLGAVTVSAGCVGGRHRSAVVADQLAVRARSAGWVTEVDHRDIDKPVLTSQRGTSVADGSPRRAK